MLTIWTKRWFLLEGSKEKIGSYGGSSGPFGDDGIDGLLIGWGHSCDKVFNLYFESQSTIVSLGL